MTVSGLTYDLIVSSITAAAQTRDLESMNKVMQKIYDLMLVESKSSLERLSQAALTEAEGLHAKSYKAIVANQISSMATKVLAVKPALDALLCEKNFDQVEQAIENAPHSDLNRAPLYRTLVQMHEENNNYNEASRVREKALLELEQFMTRYSVDLQEFRTVVCKLVNGHVIDEKMLHKLSNLAEIFLFEIKEKSPLSLGTIQKLIESFDPFLTSEAIDHQVLKIFYNAISLALIVPEQDFPVKKIVLAQLSTLFKRPDEEVQQLKNDARKDYETFLLKTFAINIQKFHQDIEKISHIDQAMIPCLVQISDSAQQFYVDLTVKIQKDLYPTISKYLYLACDFIEDEKFCTLAFQVCLATIAKALIPGSPKPSMPLDISHKIRMLMINSDDLIDEQNFPSHLKEFCKQSSLPSILELSLPLDEQMEAKVARWKQTCTDVPS